MKPRAIYAKNSNINYSYSAQYNSNTNAIDWQQEVAVLSGWNLFTYHIKFSCVKTTLFPFYRFIMLRLNFSFDIQTPKYMGVEIMLVVTLIEQFMFKIFFWYIC